MIINDPSGQITKRFNNYFWYNHSYNQQKKNKNHLFWYVHFWISNILHFCLVDRIRCNAIWRAYLFSQHEWINLAAEIKWSLTVNPVLQVSGGEEALDVCGSLLVFKHSEAQINARLKYKLQYGPATPLKPPPVCYVPPSLPVSQRFIWWFLCSGVTTVW